MVLSVLAKIVRDCIALMYIRSAYRKGNLFMLRITEIEIMQTKQTSNGKVTKILKIHKLINLEIQLFV